MKSSMFEKFKNHQVGSNDIARIHGGESCSPCTNGCQLCVDCWALLWGGECTTYTKCGCSGSGGGGPCTDPFGCPEK